MALAQDGITVHPGDTTAFGANKPYRGLEWRSTHKPEYHIYLFNVSPRSYDPEMGTGFGAGKLGGKGILVRGVQESDPSLELPIEGNDKTRKYSYITSFPQPIMVSKPNLESNEMTYVETDVRRYVIDLINPDNLTLSLDTQIAPDQVFSVGNDYSRRGIFFDYEPPEGFERDEKGRLAETPRPSREYMAKAIKRMESYYKTLLDVAANLEMTDKPRLSQELSSNPDYACAANYFGKDVVWNRVQVRPVKCINCGESKPAGVKFHMASFGTICVEPTIEAWRAAMDSGLIQNIERVPPKFRMILAKEWDYPASEAGD